MRGHFGYQDPQAQEPWGVDAPLIIGGLTSFGSGSVMRKITETYAHDYIDTSGLSIEGVFGILSKIRNRNVIFQPSIAKFSWFRDVVIALAINFFGNSKTILVLCDPGYATPAWLANQFMRIFVFSGARKVFAPAHNVLIKKASGRLPIYCLHHLSVTRSDKNQKMGDCFYLFANYLTSDKGLELFLSRCSSGVIIGNGSFRVVGENYSVSRTYSKLEFDAALDSYLNRRPIYCYLSKYDLAPLLLQEIIARGFVIAVLRGSRAEEILRSQYYDVEYVYLSESTAESLSASDYDSLSERNRNKFEEYINEVSSDYSNTARIFLS